MADGKILNIQLDRAMNSPGVPMVNRLLCATGATGAAGETVTIGADVYELRADTPPTGGTAGRTWVYNGGAGGVLATIRTNLINAINGVVDAPNITPKAGGPVEHFLASQPVAGQIQIVSATTHGGAATASAVATACAETLGNAADVWDQATCVGGRAEAQTFGCAAGIALTAPGILKGTLRVEFPFAPVGCIVQNRNRDNVEAVTITGNCVILVTAGGAAPNGQAADVIDVFAWA